MYVIIILTQKSLKGYKPKHCFWLVGLLYFSQFYLKNSDFYKKNKAIKN